MEMDVSRLVMIETKMTLCIVLSKNLYHILLLNDHRARMMISAILKLLRGALSTVSFLGLTLNSSWDELIQTTFASSCVFQFH